MTYDVCILFLRDNDARLILRRKLKGTTTLRVQTESQAVVNVDNCFDLVGSGQHDVASNKVIGCSTDHPLNAYSDDLRFSNPNFWRLANMQKRVTKDNSENPEYHVFAAISRLQTAKSPSRRTIMAKPCENRHAKPTGGESGASSPLFTSYLLAGSLCLSRVTQRWDCLQASHELAY